LFAFDSIIPIARNPRNGPSALLSVAHQVEEPTERAGARGQHLDDRPQILPGALAGIPGGGWTRLDGQPKAEPFRQLTEVPGASVRILERAHPDERVE
jgi:hypothetical protein